MLQSMGLQRVKHDLAAEQQARSLTEAELGMLGEVETCRVWHPAVNTQEAITDIATKTSHGRDFPDGPVTKTLHSQCSGPRFDP